MRETLFRATPWLVFAAVAVLAIVASRIERASYDRDIGLLFKNHTRRVESAIQQRMGSYVDAHYSGVGLFAASDNVTEDEWRNFVRAIRLVERYPGVNGLGYAVAVSHRKRDEFVASIRKVSGSKYDITPSGERDDYYAIKFIEPIESNRPALGFDMGSESTRRTAMDAARDRGVPVLSGQVVLVQDAAKTPGFLLYVPVYDSDQPVVPAADRRRVHRGWVYAPFIAEDFFRGVLAQDLAQLRADVSFVIRDAEADESMYAHVPDKRSADGLSSTSEIDLYGRVWNIEFAPTLAFWRKSPRRTDTLLLTAGLLLGAALFFAVFVLGATRRRALALATEMTSELNAQTTALRRSNEELDSFAHIASHDLKEPLRGMHNYANFVVEDYAELLPESGVSMLETIAAMATRMTALIDRLLYFSKVGRTELGIRPVDLDKVLTGVLETLEIRLEEKGTAVHVPRPLPVVTCDMARVVEIFSNLVTNAMKYNDKVNPQIEIGFIDGAVPQFYVKDNGIGIPESHHEAVFRIFKRLHKQDAFDGGTGAGLTIAKKIVERHNGRMWIESIVSEGTTFYFTLGGESDA